MGGEPSHFEIGVPDVGRAQRFYGELFGWAFETTPHGARIAVDGELSGGIHYEEDAAGIQLFYAVPDIDEATRRVIELGGEVDDAGEDGAQGRWLYSTTANVDGPEPG